MREEAGRNGGNVKITLEEYLDSTHAEQGLKDLIQLIAAQAGPIRRAFLDNQTYAGTINQSGEEQAAMDTWADQHITEALQDSGLVREIASEERDDVLRIPESREEYAVVMDPLDGSSLIQVNLTVGTIVGIYNHGTVMQAGEKMRAALYMLYGPMTVLTLSVGEGVQIFALDNNGQYVLLEANVQMPEGNLYGSGGLRTVWTKQHADFIDSCEKDGCKLRYSGSFVADFHQILKYGGIYCYPAVIGKAQGKLRLIFEANPIGFIAAQAGGSTCDGQEDVLTIDPAEPHQRTPLYVGSKGLIEKVKGTLCVRN